MKTKNLISFLACLWDITDKSKMAMDAAVTLYNAVKDDRWITTENGNRALLGADGTVKAGFGGRYNGKHISQVGEKTSAETEAQNVINKRIEKTYGKKRVSSDKRAELIREYIEEEMNNFTVEQAHGGGEEYLQRAEAAYRMLERSGNITSQERNSLAGLKSMMGSDLSSGMVSEWERQAFEAEFGNRVSQGRIEYEELPF